MHQTNETPIIAGSSNLRIVWIDWAKVFGIYLVILGHMSIRGKPLLYCFHMPFFFMISGYLYKHVPIVKEINKTLRSLIVPYIIYNLILLFVVSCFQKVSGNMLIDIALGNQELLPRIFRPLWFVISLIIMRFFCSLCKEDWLFPLMIITLCFCIVMKKMDVLQNSYCDDYFQMQTSIVCLPFFLFGWIAKKNDFLGYANRLIFQCRTLIICMIIGVGFLLGIYNGMVNALTCETGKNVIVYYAVGFVISASLMWLCSILLVVKSKLIQSISEGTILILAVHLAMIDGLTYVFKLSMLWSIVSSVIIMGICVIIVLFAKRYCPILIGKKKLSCPVIM